MMALKPDSGDIVWKTEMPERGEQLRSGTSVASKFW